MLSYQTQTPIHAEPQIIWALLTNADTWPAWNTTVTRVEGDIALGATIKVYAKISPGRAFPVKVAVLEPNERMVWSSGMPLGLFKGKRTFTLTPQPDGSVLFDMHEVFSGLLAPLITRSIPNLQPAFDEFAAALKHAAEAV